MNLKQLRVEKEKVAKSVKFLESGIEKLEFAVDERIDAVKKKLEWGLVKIREDLSQDTNKLKAQLAKVNRYIETLEQNLDAHLEALEREAKAENKKLLERIAELEEFIGTIDFVEDSEENLTEKDEHFLRARTLAIFDKILFLISKWAKSGEIAVDFEVASRAILIPSVYVKICKYEEHYLLEDFPDFQEVVINGREFISQLRQDYNTLASRDTWEDVTLELKIWWTDYAIPRILGYTDPNWEFEKPLSWEASNKWETNPKDQMSMFPQLYDTFVSQGEYEGLTVPISPISRELDKPEYKV